MTEPEVIRVAQVASAAGQRLYVVRYRGGTLGVCTRDPSLVKGARIVWDSVGGVRLHRRYERAECSGCGRDRVVSSRGVCFACHRAALARRKLPAIAASA
jgi:hypothetical protein